MTLSFFSSSKICMSSLVRDHVNILYHTNSGICAAKFKYPLNLYEVSNYIKSKVKLMERHSLAWDLKNIQ